MSPRRPCIALAYQPTGFQPRGGLQRLALNLVDHLQGAGAQVDIVLAQGRRHGLEDYGLGLATRRRLNGVDALVLLGCDQPWAYGLALAQRLRRPRLPLHWLPCFHDPARVNHPLRARLAASTLKGMQRLGVQVHALTTHEQALLDAGRCHLSSHALGSDLRRWLECATPPLPDEERPVDLLFLGRATSQKGWHRFLRLAERANLRCTAMVPSLLPEERRAAERAGLTILLNADDITLRRQLRRTKLVTIPADYESFGLAQIEALSQGCLVPLLGHWPLWEGFAPLQWQGWSDERLAAACMELCRNPRARQRLVTLQQAYLRDHPILNAPFVPGLLREVGVG